MENQKTFAEIFKGPLDSCLERYIGLGLGVGLGFVGQWGDSGIKFCEQHLSDPIISSQTFGRILSEISGTPVKT